MPWYQQHGPSSICPFEIAGYLKMVLVTSLLTSHIALHPASEWQLPFCPLSILLSCGPGAFFRVLVPYCPSPLWLALPLLSAFVFNSHLIVAYSLGPLDSPPYRSSTPDLTTLCLGLRLQLSGQMLALARARPQVQSQYYQEKGNVITSCVFCVHSRKGLMPSKFVIFLLTLPKTRPSPLQAGSGGSVSVV